MAQYVEVEVIFDYVAQKPDELTIKVGDVIKNVIQSEDGWFEGELKGKKGMFPDNFVKVIQNDVKKDEKERVKVRENRKDIQTRLRSAIYPVYRIKDKVNDGHVPGRTKVSATNRAKSVFAYEPEYEDELGLSEEEGSWGGIVHVKQGVSNSVEIVTESEPSFPKVTDKNDEDAARAYDRDRQSPSQLSPLNLDWGDLCRHSLELPRFQSEVEYLKRLLAGKEAELRREKEMNRENRLRIMELQKELEMEKAMSKVRTQRITELQREVERENAKNKAHNRRIKELKLEADELRNQLRRNESDTQQARDNELKLRSKGMCIDRTEAMGFEKRTQCEGEHGIKTPLLADNELNLRSKGMRIDRTEARGFEKRTQYEGEHGIKTPLLAAAKKRIQSAKTMAPDYNPMHGQHHSFSDAKKQSQSAKARDSDFKPMYPPYHLHHANLRVPAQQTQRRLFNFHN